jgi:hypothetical protein
MYLNENRQPVSTLPFSRDAIVTLVAGHVLPIRKMVAGVHGVEASTLRQIRQPLTCGGGTVDELSTTRNLFDPPDPEKSVSGSETRSRCGTYGENAQSRLRCSPVRSEHPALPGRNMHVVGVARNVVELQRERRAVAFW